MALGPFSIYAIQLVTKNPGFYTRDTLREAVQKEFSIETSSMNKALGQLVTNNRLYQATDGLMYPTAPTETVTKSGKSAQGVSATATPFLFDPHHTEPISVSDLAKVNPFPVEFTFEAVIKKAVRVGYSQATSVNDVWWIPTQARLEVRLGDYTPQAGMELVKATYLVIVVPENGGYVAKFFKAPKPHSYAIRWAN